MDSTKLSVSQAAKLIDQTLLKPTATQEQITALCTDAAERGFASVCVPTCWIELSKSLLKGSGVKVCTVIGFPLGNSAPSIKALEAAEAIRLGADEIDMVAPIGLVKGDEWDAVEADISAVRKATKGHVLKVIIEACLLTDEEKVMLCKACVKCGADFVKTSTGFSTSGAVPSDVKLMKQTVGDKAQVKAAGGIRVLATFMEMYSSGATRIGTSSGVQILTELEKLNKS